jgi:hypothetical protein
MERTNNHDPGPPGFMGSHNEPRGELALAARFFIGLIDEQFVLTLHSPAFYTPPHFQLTRRRARWKSRH